MMYNIVDYYIIEYTTVVLLSARRHGISKGFSNTIINHNIIIRLNDITSNNYY